MKYSRNDMNYEDKLVLAKSLKKKSIRLAPSDSVLLEVKNSLDRIVANNDQSTDKLIQFVTELSETLSANDFDRTGKDKEYFNTLVKALDFIQQEIKSIVIPEMPDSIKVEGLEQLIKSIPVPKASPIRVVLKDDDIYSRYKRVNSAIKSGVTYHGFADQNGNWFIQREATSANGATTRYIAGGSNFDLSWAKRASLNYLPFYEVTIP